MMRNELLRTIKSFQRNLVISRHKASATLDIEKLEQENAAEVEVFDEEAEFREEMYERKRNKSRLREADRNILMGRKPYEEPMHWSHGKLKYNRRIYGKYGAASGVDPALCWPTNQELNEALEYEKVAYPFTIPQMIEMSKKKKEEQENAIRERQEGIVKKMAKLDGWIADLSERIAKKEAAANAAKEQRERLIEEVRRHFGYTVDPREDKFKELLEKKEKEQKKAMKEARKKVKEEKLLAKLLNKGKDEKEVKKEPKEKKEPEVTET